MPATNTPTEDRVRERIERDRADLTERIQHAEDGKHESCQHYTEALDRMNALSAEVIALDDNGKEIPAEKQEQLNDAHRECMRLMNAAVTRSRSIRDMRVKLEALDDPREFQRRVDVAERLATLRRPEDKDAAPRRPTTQDAAVTVLVEQGNAMHYREVTRLALESGLLQTKGKTPEATMNAMLSVEAKAGRTFKKVAPGVFDLLDRDAETKKAKAEAKPDEPKAEPKLTAKPAAKKPRAKAKAGA